MHGVPDYTATECLRELREIDAQIKALRTRPTATSAKGVSVDYQDKIDGLLKERRLWAQHLRQARAWNGRDTPNGAQGPKLTLE